ncbi:MAG: two-component regulator propeller domain-containing protein [Acidobacteriota bacterium]|nr:two-component regulator propeller domain-containing protein [Acidobacteriota bacterium]
MFSSNFGISLIGTMIIATFPISNPAARTESPRFQPVLPERGLMNSMVEDVLQDRKGYLWIATNGGLHRYDGYRMRVFRHDPTDSASIPDNIIITLFEDSRGRLWVGTYHSGICRFEAETETFVSFRDQSVETRPPERRHVSAIGEDDDGYLWFGFRGGGLARFHPERPDEWINYRHDPDDPRSLSQDHVLVIHRDRDGRMWFGTLSGLNRWDSRAADVFKRYAMEPDPLRVWSMFEDNDGTLWLGTTQWGLIAFDPRTGDMKTYDHDPKNPGSLDDHWVLAIHRDRSGALWVGTNRGLNRFHPESGSFTRYHHRRGVIGSLSANQVNAVCEDRAGVLWFATSKGLDKLVPQAAVFSHLSIDDFLPGGEKSDPAVRAVCQDRTGTLWLGTDSGVFRFDKTLEPVVRYTRGPDKAGGLISNNVRTFYSDRSGALWIGTDHGLSRLEPESGRVSSYGPTWDEKYPRVLSHDNVNAIVEDRTGTIWVGTGKGLNRYDDQEDSFDRFYDGKKGLPTVKIWSLHVGREGKLWVGSDQGLYGFDRANELLIAEGESKPNGRQVRYGITCILEDRRGALWLGTPAGLRKWEHRKETAPTRVYRESDGLSSDMINAVVETEGGQLWVSTSYGLARLDPISEEIRCFDRRDGLLDNELIWGSASQSADGRLLFGGLNGLTMFHPERIFDNPLPPPVVLTSIEILDHTDSGSMSTVPVEGRNELTLTHRDLVVSFEFAALDYAAPEKNQYAYRLRGLGDEWITVDADNRKASFTTLPRGNYRLEIKAANKDGVWNEQGVSLPIRVKPPPWLSWWAWCLYGLALTLLMGAYLRSHRKKLQRESEVNAHLKRVDQLKDDFLAYTSQELRTPLVGMISLAETLIADHRFQTAPEAGANLSMIAATGRRLSLMVDDILDLSMLKHGSLDLRFEPVALNPLAEVVLTMAGYLPGSNRLRLVNRIAADLPVVRADKSRLQQILYNLVSHAIEHTLSGAVTISARKEETRIVVEVADTGGGIQPPDREALFGDHVHSQGQAELSEVGVRFGLAISRRLIQAHGGRLDVQSVPGQGACFSFDLGRAEGKGAEPGSDLKPAFAVPRPSTEPRRPTDESFHILVVDDDPVTREVVSGFLSQDGYRCSTRADGEEALRLLDEEDADLLITALVLPGISGFEICRRLRKTKALDELPIIFLAGAHGDRDWKTGYALGGNDFLTKPVSRTELLVRVRTHLKLLDRFHNVARKVAERTQELNEEHLRRSRLFKQFARELEIALQKIRDGLDEENLGPRDDQERFAGLRHRMEQLLMRIDHLSEVAWLEAGGFFPATVPGDLSDFLRDRVRAFENTAREKGVALVYDPPPQPITPVFDRDKLGRIVAHLLTYALAQTPRGGKVCLAAHLLGNEVEISIKDTGSGVDDREFVDLAEWLYPTDDTSRIPWNLGPALAKKLVQLHGGALTIERQAGFGSEVRFTLPLRPAGLVETSLDERVEPDASKLLETPLESESSTDEAPLVLIIGDDPDARALLVRCLSTEYHLLTAAGARKGSILAREAQPRLIICEFLWSGTDGASLCHELKTDEETARIPVLLITARVPDETMDKEYRRPADDYLVKPYDERELLAHTRHLIETHELAGQRYHRDLLLGPHPRSISSADDRFLEKAREALHRNLDNHLFGVDALAEELGISRRQLHRRVKALTGHGPGALVRSYRLEQAAHLLEQRAGTVAEIAYNVGFRKPRYFADLFRRTYGKNPSQYAAEARSRQPE